MKHLILIVATSLVLVSCNSMDIPAQSSVEVDKEFEIQGVWNMTHRYFYDDGEITETMVVSPENRQIKIFTATKYMWSSMPRDAKDWHAYGTYEFDGTTLIENKEYASQSMQTHMGATATQIEVTDSGFKQIFSDPEDGIFYAEKFQRVE